MANKDQNIQDAKLQIENAGGTIEAFCGYSESNGVSVYFRIKESDLKVRVSNHTVTNKDRVFNEIHMSFNQTDLSGKVIDKTNRNKASLLYKLGKIDLEGYRALMYK